ncbi:hypothetical protein AAY473_025002 [Plecturocebus cupreus]
MVPFAKLTGWIPKEIEVGVQMQWLKPAVPALWEAKVGELLESRSLRPASVKLLLTIYIINLKKISLAWWPTPVVPATREDCLSLGACHPVRGNDVCLAQSAPYDVILAVTCTFRSPRGRDIPFPASLPSRFCETHSELLWDADALRISGLHSENT